MLDAFYTGKDAYHRVKQRSADLFHLLMGRIERIERRVAAQREELTACAQREELRVCGDLLQSALYQIQKGDRVAKVPNYYSEAGETVEIPLDARLTPAQNAQAYYKKYRKLCTAEEKLKALIEQGEEEIRYLESVFDSLTRATGEDELAVIRQELCDQGYLRQAGKKGNRPKMRGPLEFVLDDGYTPVSYTHLLAGGHPKSVHLQPSFFSSYTKEKRMQMGVGKVTAPLPLPQRA